MLIFDDALTGDNRCTIINNFFMELKQIPSNNAAQLTRGDIETRLNNVYSQFISQSQSHYSIVIPSKILYTSISNSSFTIKNVTINVIQSNSIDSNFNFNNEFDEIISRNDIFPFFSDNNNAFFHIEVIANNQYEAANSALQFYELYRSIINYSFRYQRLYRQLGKLDPLSLISKPPFLFIFDENNKILSYDLNHYPIFNPIFP